MHLGGLLSIQEAGVALGLNLTFFILSSLPREPITRKLHAARLPFLSYYLNESYRYTVHVHITVYVCSLQFRFKA